MSIDPLEITIDVRCSADHAFDTWCRRTSLWWPKGHSVSKDPATTVVIEQHLGGRIFERTSSGEEIDWGQVTLWDPPRRLGYLWHIGRAAEDATDVIITFVDRGDGTARVQITHSGWERLGPEGQQWRDANAGGWASLLPHFTAASADTSQT